MTLEANGNTALTNIFKDVVFAVILGQDLQQAQALHIIDELKSYGAKHCSLDPSKLQDVTHLIATTSDFPAYHDALDSFIHVVTPRWIEQSILKGKPANLRQFSPDPSLFLSDVTVCCADDIPQGDKEAIISGVVAMGGHYSPFMTKMVTHVVALTSENQQCQVAKEKNLGCKQVLPHWFQDCLKLGKKIDPGPYLLPSPPILETTQPPPVARTPDDLKHANSLSPGPLLVPESGPSDFRIQLNVFQNKNVMLHEDLGLSRHLRGTMQEIITNGGGSCVNKVLDADMLICQYRFGEDFAQATRAGKETGNLNWLYHMINYNRWTSPTRRLLHYPLPVETDPEDDDFRIGIPGTSNMAIAVSNFAGEARIYLENLVRAFGGKYTKTLSPDNTHLITAHPTGDKYTAAKEWNIHVVNHLWLEESYAKATVQSISTIKYITFPEQTNLGELLGRTPIDRDAITSAYMLQGSITGSTLGELDPNTETRASQPNSDGSSSERSQTAELKYSSLPPAAPGQENRPRASARSAKERALDKLHSMASDIAIFEKETKRVGGVIYGGRRVSDPERIPINKRKRKDERDQVEATVGTVESSTDHSTSYKMVKANTKESPNEPFLRILITGHTPNKCARKVLQKLNIELAQDSSKKVDILVAPRLLRTRKFLSALGHGPAIVNSVWVDQMVEQQLRLPWKQYVLEDENGEKNYGARIDRIQKLAKQHADQGGILKGWTIFCTEGVRSGFDTYQEVAATNGGFCVLFRGRQMALVQEQNWKENYMIGSNMGNEVSPPGQAQQRKPLYLISDPSDKALWPKFREVAKKEGFVPSIVAPDWFLDVIMKQDISLWENDYVYDS